MPQKTPDLFVRPATPTICPPPTYAPTTCLSIHLFSSVPPSTPFICASGHPFLVCLSIHTWLPTSLPPIKSIIHSPIHPSIRPPTICPPTYPSIHTHSATHPSTHLLSACPPNLSIHPPSTPCPSCPPSHQESPSHPTVSTHISIPQPTPRIHPLPGHPSVPSLLIR